MVAAVARETGFAQMTTARTVTSAGEKSATDARWTVRQAWVAAPEVCVLFA